MSGFGFGQGLGGNRSGGSSFGGASFTALAPSGDGDEGGDEVVCKYLCKLFRFKKATGKKGEEGYNEGGWGDLGKMDLWVKKLGPKKGYILARQFETDLRKIYLNAPFYKGMKVERLKGKKGDLSIICPDGGSLVKYLIRVKNPAYADKLAQDIRDYTPQ